MYDFRMTARGDGMDIAEWGGYKAQSKNGASCKLCRVLVGEGYADAPVTLWNEGTRSMVFPSMHQLAHKTFYEGEKSPRMATYVPDTRNHRK